MRTGVRVYPSSRDAAGGKGLFHSQDANTETSRVTANSSLTTGPGDLSLALEVKLRKKRHVVGREDRRGQRRVLLHQSLVRHLEQPPHR